jgi:ferredoxin
MRAVRQAAEQRGWPEDAVHGEYFAVPDQEERENHPFTLRLAGRDRAFVIPAERSATDILADHGIHVDVKCSEGICGVCRTRLVDGEVDHRDFVLAGKDRADTIMLCCSRALEPGGTITVDLGDRY